MTEAEIENIIACIPETKGGLMQKSMTDFHDLPSKIRFHVFLPEKTWSASTGFLNNLKTSENLNKF